MKNLKWLLLTLTFLLQIPTAHSEPLKFLFFYPGGQGTEELAQPILDLFGEELKKASDGKLDFKMTYLSDLKEGLTFIQTQKPAAILLTYDLFQQYKTQWQGSSIAQTLQLPTADGFEQYFILGKKGGALPTVAPWTLLTSTYISSPYFQKNLFPNLKVYPSDLKTTQNVIGELRKIGSGQKEGEVLVDAFEMANIKKLKFPWVQNIDTLATSEKTNSSLVMALANNLSLQATQELTSALLKIGHQKSAQPVLTELRLKGFK